MHMTKIVYTGTLSKWHDWALNKLKGHKIELVTNNPNYEDRIKQADICLSIMPEGINTHILVNTKIFDYIKHRKPIMHFTPYWNDEGAAIINDLGAGKVFTPDSTTTSINDFIRNPRASYKYNNEYHIDTAVNKLMNILKIKQ